MLLKRFATALILMPLVLISIINSTNNQFVILSGLIVAFISYEWSGLYKPSRVLQSFFIFLVIILGLFFNYNSIYSSLMININVLTWVILIGLVIYYNSNDKSIVFDKINSSVVLQFLIGLFLFIPFWLAIIMIKSNEPAGVLIFPLLMVWSIDTGAYFSGKLLGKNKLIVNVSPNKTWEGLLGAFISLLLLNVIVCFAFSNVNMTEMDLYYIAKYAISIIIVFIFATFGDLAQSMFKRIALVKDSGSLLPGHGGIFDRLDSFIAIMPVYYLIIQFHKIA